jgi:uncharacterized damage-inducible protein DinB
MNQQTPNPDLATIATSELERYFRHLAQRVDRAARAVTQEQLWTRPFRFGNSIGHLVLHLTGNLNHYIGALVGASGYVRRRDHEFTDPVKHAADEILARFHEAVDLVVHTLRSQDAQALASPVPDQAPIETRLGLFLVCAAHMNNHIGQMSYLLEALQSSTHEPPAW